MSQVFADTGYFVALLSTNDAHHRDAINYAELVDADRTIILVTTDAVLIELLNFFARRGEQSRAIAIDFVRLLLASGGSRVEPQTRDLLNDAIGLYAEREDKDWSVTDCMSLIIMDRLGISDALAHDRAFTQGGKRALLRNDE